MTSASRRALGVASIAALLAASASASASASSATSKTCSRLPGRSLVAGRVVRVVRVKLPTIAPRGPDAGTERRVGLFSCKLPNGAVHRLAVAGSSYFPGQKNSPVERTAVGIGSSSGRFVTLTEADNTLMGEGFLTGWVIDAASGRRLYSYLKTSGSELPSRSAPLRTLLGPAGTLVGLFPLLSANATQTTEQLVAFTNSKGQVLDTAADGSIPPASITLIGNTVGWSDAGGVRSATIAPLAASR
jgi:hypothetical protein